MEDSSGLRGRSALITGGALAQPTARADHRRDTAAEPLHDHVASVRRGPGRDVDLHAELTDDDD
jgi:hypothetical protein